MPLSAFPPYLEQPRLPPPTHLKASGRRFFNDITAEWEQRSDELSLLVAACEQLDIAERRQVVALHADRVSGASPKVPRTMFATLHLLSEVLDSAFARVTPGVDSLAVAVSR
jgi:hypothetical protein